MGRETTETCPTCESLCRSIECGTHEHKYFKPIIDGSLGQENGRAKILAMLAEAKFCQLRLQTAMTMLHHVEEFLRGHGHKFMHLQVKRTLDNLLDRRCP